jgi:hypothetical protein
MDTAFTAMDTQSSQETTAMTPMRHNPDEAGANMPENSPKNAAVEVMKWEETTVEARQATVPLPAATLETGQAIPSAY